MDLKIIVRIVLLFSVICIFYGLYQDRKLKRQKFDERQKMIQNQGYKYGLFTIIACFFILIVLPLVSDLHVPFSQNNVIAILFLGLGVSEVYDILNGAYFSMRMKHVLSIGLIFLGVGIADFYLAIDDFINSALSASTGILGILGISLSLSGLAIITSGTVSIRQVSHEKFKNESSTRW
ncbi:MAG TPA: hypothetical protein H9783_03520 [Candidatus Limosilactobacillus faecipullorum]|nr:hypothetical protein [Candidatus Limosilactobacillus faecipullorum]